jgi:hypothetical protein
MTRIQHRRGRHFMDEKGRLFWINGPDDHCYLSEQRQWRRGLCFEDVLEWKQCAPTGMVSQRFSSPTAACEAFAHAQVVWSTDLYLRRMGEEMARQRCLADYKPTAMRLAESRGARPRLAPWSLPQPSGPVCDLRVGVAPAVRPSTPLGRAGSERAAAEEVPHLLRRRRGEHASSR